MAQTILIGRVAGPDRDSSVITVSDELCSFFLSAIKFPGFKLGPQRKKGQNAPKDWRLSSWLSDLSRE